MSASTFDTSVATTAVAAPPPLAPHATRPKVTTVITHSHNSHHGHGGDTSFKALLAGGVGGTFEVLTDHPIDMVKVRMQTASASSSSAAAFQGGDTAAVRRPRVSTMLQQIIAEGGFAGLYRGSSIRVATLMPCTAISFWGLDVGKRLVRNTWSLQPFEPLSVAQVTLAGGLSGIPVTLFATPSEQIKCLLQIQSNANKAAPMISPSRRVGRVFQQAPAVPRAHYGGPLDCGMQIYRAGGLPGLYRGFGITLARNIPGYAVWFGCYEFLTPKMATVFGADSLMTIIMAGGLAGSVSWAAMIPFDGIKSRIQTSPHPISVKRAYRELTRRQGPRALFRGLGPAVLIAFPANAACFVGYDAATKLFSCLE